MAVRGMFGCVCFVSQKDRSPDPPTQKKISDFRFQISDFKPSLFFYPSLSPFTSLPAQTYGVLCVQYKYRDSCERAHLYFSAPQKAHSHTECLHTQYRHIFFLLATSSLFRYTYCTVERESRDPSITQQFFASRCRPSRALTSHSRAKDATGRHASSSSSSSSSSSFLCF